MFALKHGLRCQWPWLSRGWLLLAGCELGASLFFGGEITAPESKKTYFFGKN
eukprot:COSAG01_NODE_2733_length_7167_cov_48.846067_4_plen_52_part_00